MKGTAQVHGRLGKDAEVKNFENGRSVIEFSVASNIYYRKDGELQTKTDWHDAKIFVKEVNDDFVARLTKGTEITLFGGISYNEYTPENGPAQKRMFIDARPGDVAVCGGSPEQTEEEESSKEEQA